MSAFPSMKQLFLVREDLSKQSWSSNGKRYNIQCLYDYAQAVADPEEIPIQSLMYGFERTNLDEEPWSDEFVQRCQEADLQFPILVVQDKHHLFIADGNHRFGKAIMQARELISGYIVQERDLPEKAIEPKVEPSDAPSSPED